MPDVHKLSARGRERARRALERVRHARHPLHGWRRWAFIAVQAALGLFLLFALVNLALWFTVDRPGGAAREALWEAELDGMDDTDDNGDDNAPVSAPPTPKRQARAAHGLCSTCDDDD